MQFAPANTVKPKKTELIPVKICINSTKLIRIEQIIVKQAIDTKNEYMV